MSQSIERAYGLVLVVIFAPLVFEALPLLLFIEVLNSRDFSLANDLLRLIAFAAVLIVLVFVHIMAVIGAHARLVNLKTWRILAVNAFNAASAVVGHLPFNTAVEITLPDNTSFSLYQHNAAEFRIVMKPTGSTRRVYSLIQDDIEDVSRRPLAINRDKVLKMTAAMRLYVSERAAQRSAMD